jgi:hypothetical protein
MVTLSPLAPLFLETHGKRTLDTEDGSFGLYDSPGPYSTTRLSSKNRTNSSLSVSSTTTFLTLQTAAFLVLDAGGLCVSPGRPLL